MDEQILKDFIATAQANNYNYDVVMPKFPELSGIDLQVLKDYIATAEANNYNYAVVNPKFPEIFGDIAPQTTETVAETIEEGPKKKGFFESLGQQAGAEGIATVSASTSEGQPSSSESRQTPEDIQQELDSKLASLGITPQQQQADDAFVPTPEGVATQDRGTAFTPTIQAPLEDVSQETADVRDAGQQAAVQGEIGQYELNQQEAMKMNESEGIESFQVETIESDASPQYDFGSKTFVETKDKTYLAYPEGMTLEQAREEGKVMEFTTEEQAKYFAKGGWKDKDPYIGTALGEVPLAGQDATEQRINMITDDFFKETSKSRKNQLEALFSDYGFTFELAGKGPSTRKATRFEIIVTAPDGETYEMGSAAFSRYFESSRVSEARMFKDFMRRNIKSAKTSVEGYAAQINKAKNIFKGEEDIEDARVIFNKETNEFMSEVGSFAERQNEIIAQGEMFNNYTLRQINADPELKAKYTEFEKQVESLEAEAAKLQERQNFFIKKGADLDKMVASYDFLQSQKGNYRTGIFKALLRGIAKTTSGGTMMLLDLSDEFGDEIEGGTITNPNTGETQLVGKKLRAQFTSEYAVDLFQEDPDKYYFGGSDASIKMFFGEDGAKAVDIIESGNLNEENSKFLSDYLEGLGADRADRFLNNFKVKGTAEEGDRITNVSGYSYTTGGSDDIGLGDAIKDEYKDLGKKYTKYYSDTGTFEKALSRYLEQGTLARFAPNPFSVEAGQSMLDKGIVDAISDALPTMAAGSNTEQWEQMQKEGFWGGAILGAFESLPQMIGGNWAGRTAKMFAFGASHVDEEIRTNPETANMTENEKYKLIVPIGIANAVLEEVGVRSILNNKNVLHNVVKNSMLKSGKSTTASQFSNIVKGEVDNVLARGGIVLGRAGLVEFETGALQELSSVGIKELYNISKDKDMFETPDTFKELVGQVLYAGAQEAVGGFIMGTPNAISAAAKKNAIPSITDEQFKIFEAIVADDTYQQMYETRLKQRVAAGEITQQQAIEEKKEFGAIAQASLKIPADYTTAQKKEALGLLLEKQRIESSIEDKSSELTKKQQGKLRDIDGQLESIQTRAIEQEQSQRESEAAIPDIAQKEEQEKQQEMYDNAVTEQEKRDVEEMFGVPEGEMEGRKGPNIFINKKGKRASEMNAEQEAMRGRVIEMAAKAAKAISKVTPDTNIVLYETTAEFENATGRQGRGFFGFDGTVHINLEQATETTVPHEIMHAVLFDKFGSRDPNDTQQIAMAKAATQMVSSVRKTIDANSELAKRLDAFASKYEAGVQNEEQLSELFGIMAAEYTSLKPRSRSAIVNFFKDIAKRFGIDLGPKFGQNDADVVELMNTLSRKVRTGETIVEEDVAALEGVRVLEDTSQEQGSEGEVGTFGGFREQKEAIDTPKAKDDSRSWVRDKVEDVDITTLEGRNFITNMYDYTNAGKTDLGNGFSIELLGGRNYAPIIMSKTGKNIGDVSNLAAFNSKSQAEGFIRNSLEGEANLFAPHSGTLDGSWQFQQHIFEALVDLVLDNKILSKKQLIDVFNSGIQSKEGKKAFDKFNGKNNSKLKNLSSFKSSPKELVRLLDIQNNFSPDLRKILNQKIAADKTFQEAIGVKNLNEFHERITDPLNRGVVGGEIMTLIEFDPTTFEVVQTKPGDVDHHPSFGWVVKAKIERIMQPTKFYKSYDVTDTYTKYNKDGAAVSRKSDANYAQANVTSSAGAIPKIATISTQQEQEYTKTGRRQMGEFESKAPIDEFGDIDGYAMEQAYDLANSRGIRIGRLKEVSNVVTNAEGNIVGATFTDYTDGVYSFDIVVDESVEGQGVGTLLLEDAMYPPFDMQDMDPNVKTRIEVVNPVMQSMLESRGFRVTKKLGPDNVIMEPAKGREQRSYPLEDISLWYGESNYKSTGGKLIYMTPKQFLGLAKPLKMDEETRENVDDLKAHIEDGKKLDPLTLYGTDRTNVRDSDGRHRAIASMELGIQEVPVVDFTGQTIGREQKEAPSQKYDDDVALRIIKENNALDNPMSTGAIEYLLVERYKFPLKKVRDMMSVNLDLFDTLPKSFANIKGGKTAGIKLYNRVEAFRRKLIENNKKRTKLTDAEVDAEVAKYRASLNDGRKLTEEQITAQTKSYRESLTRLSEKEIQSEVNEFRESLEKANKRRVVKGVLITGRNKLTPAQIDAEVQAYENSIRDRNNSKPELTEQQINDKTEKFRNDLNKKNKKKADRMSLEEMQEKTAAFKDKLVKKNNKRKAKLTEEEIMDKTIEYLQAQPEYKAEGKGKSNRLTIQQASMLSQLQKQVGIRPSQNIGRKIQKARTMVSESVRTRRDLQKAKASIRNFLRKTLPQSIYTTEEVLELINDITVATDENIEAVFAKVEEFVINKNTKILEAEIKAILEGKYEKTESGRRKAKTISLETNKRIQYIKSKIVPKGSKLEEFQLREARLRAELQELNNKEVLTEEEQDRAVDVIIALQLNAANEMVTEQEGITDMNAASIKLDYLDNIADTLRSMIADGKSQLKDELKAEKERLNRDKTDAYEDITGNRIDFNSKGSKQKLDDETFGREQDEIATKVGERIGRFFRDIGRGIELIFISAEALDGLMDKISRLPGEMFGGKMQELVTNKMDDSSIAFKARMMEQEAIIRDKMKELYGKKWVSAARSHSIIKETGIIARGKNLKLSQNQMYYLYNMYKDPANKASFRTMYGEDYKRVMAEMEAKLKPEVKAFADWQVNEYFPSLYNHYNDVYKKIYKTNMPLNQFYAGRIYRKNVDPQPIDLLGSAPMANNFISASSIKERVNTNAAIEAMNGTDALYSYLNEMEYFAAYAENVRDINRIFKDPNIKDAIEKINGKAVYKLIDGSIKTISNRGGQRTLMDRFVNAVTSTFVVARIAISPVIMIKQLTSMVTYMNDIGVANYMLYSAKNLVSLKSTMKEIYDNSVYVRDRKNESIFRVLESYNDNAMKKFIPSKVRTGATWFTNFLMFNTKFGDMTAILMGGSPNYSYYKAQAIKQGKTEEQAIKIAIRKFERDTKRTQQSQDLQDKDYFQNAGAATRFMGLFQTAPKQYLRKEIQAVRQFGRSMRGKGGKGTMFENFRTLVMYHAVAPTLFQYVAIGMPGILRDWREDEDYPDLARALFLGNLNSLIVFGEILNWGGDYATGKPWAGETTRALPLLSTLQKVILMQKKIDETSPDKEYYQDMIDRRNAELCTLIGIPMPTVKKFYDNYGDGIDWNDPRDALMKLLGYSQFQIKGSEAITGEKPRNIFDDDFRKQPKGKKRKRSNTRTEGRSGPSRSGRTNTGSGRSGSSRSGRTRTGSGRTNTGSGRRR